MLDKEHFNLAKAPTDRKIPDYTAALGKFHPGVDVM